jgi:predicted transcriptional regulator
MDTTLSVRLPEKLKRGLRALSVAENRPVSDLVREALTSYVAVHRFRALRAKALPFAEAAGLLSDDDVFRSLR